MKRIILWSAVGAFLAVLIAATVIIDPFTLPALDADRIRSAACASTVYAADGSAVGLLSGSESRICVAMRDLPRYVPQAFIAAEDQRFYEHGGIDVRRIFGALFQDIRSGSLSQGASTITQQLIKLTHLSSEKTLRRKLREAILAVQLEDIMTKDEILEAYLNTVYFGAGAYGIEAAARTYFDKGADALTIAEAALLAGIIKSPSGYAPHIDAEAARSRRDYVLSEMLRFGAISPQEYARAANSDVNLRMKADDKTRYGWYMDAVLAEAEEILDMRADEVICAGLQIHTGFDRKMQDAADALFADGAGFPDPASDGTPAQGALIAMDTRGGEIRCMVGGRTYSGQRIFNRATQMRRQVGSAIKPISTYAAAIDACGYLPTSIVHDERRTHADSYAPGNAGGTFYGDVPLREAVSRSLNAATVNLADEIGIGRIREYIRKFGLVLSDRDANLSLALGSMTDGASPREVCGAYCALANGGSAVSGHTIISIEDADGKVLYRYSQKANRAVSPQTAFLLTDVLTTAATSGSAKALADAGITVAAKTGTVSEAGGLTRDIWTAAYTPDIAVTAWMGFDQSDPDHAMASWVGGSSYPARLCAAFLKSCGLRDRAFPVPDGLTAVTIDRAVLDASGRAALASAETPPQYRQKEYFPIGAQPTDVSDYWHAPEAVRDLRLIDGDVPQLAFTSRDDAAEYLVIRTVKGESEIAAALTGDAGSIITWRDDARETACEYSVIPRHRDLYAVGTLLTGAESNRVRYTPKNWVDRIFG